MYAGNGTGGAGFASPQRLAHPFNAASINESSELVNSERRNGSGGQAVAPAAVSNFILAQAAFMGGSPSSTTHGRDPLQQQPLPGGGISPFAAGGVARGSGRSSGGGGASVPSPLLLEDQGLLLNLSTLHDKVFTSAIGIVTEKSEAIVRLIPGREVKRPINNNNKGGTAGRVKQPYGAGEDTRVGFGSAVDNQTHLVTRLEPLEDAMVHGGVVYSVGTHTVIPPLYCSCSAFRFSVVGKSNTSKCKHLLALDIAIALEQQALRLKVSTCGTSGLNSSSAAGGGGSETQEDVVVVAPPKPVPPPPSEGPSVLPHHTVDDRQHPPPAAAALDWMLAVIREQVIPEADFVRLLVQ